jgi:hypothetical protein
MNRTQQAWGRKKIAGALFMDAKSAFNNVNNEYLGKRMDLGTGARSYPVNPQLHDRQASQDRP